MDRGKTSREYAGRRTTAPRNAAGRPQGHSQGSRSYDGRFGSPADAGRKRPTGSYRSQPSGSYRSRMGYEASVQRPSARSGGDSYTRRPAPKAAPQPAPRKRTHKKKVNVPVLILAVLALAVLAALIILVVSSAGQTYHQLPTVERIGAAGVSGT